MVYIWLPFLCITQCHLGTAFYMLTTYISNYKCRDIRTPVITCNIAWLAKVSHGHDKGQNFCSAD